MLSQIDLSKIPAFLEVARRLNFTEAANQLYMSQSSLSKAIAALEMSVGFPLFLRTSRKVALTPEGECFYKECLRVCGEFDRAVLNARGIRDGKHGSFTIAYPGYLAKGQMFKHLAAQFAIQAPVYDLELHRVSYSEVRRMLVDGKADAVLYNQHDISVLHGYSILPIGIGEPTLLYNPKIPTAASGAEVGVADFRDRRFVAVSPEFAPSYSAFLNDCCRAYGFEPKLVKYTDSIMELIDYIGTTDYVTIMDRTIFPLTTELNAIPIPRRKGMPAPLFTILAWNGRSTNPALMRFLEIAEEQLGRKRERI